MLCAVTTGEPSEYSTSLSADPGPVVWSGSAPEPIWPELASPQQPILELVLAEFGLMTAQEASVPTTTSMGVPYPMSAWTGLPGVDDWAPPSPSSPESSLPQQ